MPEIKNTKRKNTANMHLFSSFIFPVRKSSTHQVALGINQIFKDCTFWVLELKVIKEDLIFPRKRKLDVFSSGIFFPTSYFFSLPMKILILHSLHTKNYLTLLAESDIVISILYITSQDSLTVKFLRELLPKK